MPIGHGADTNAKPEYYGGSTPLQAAAEAGHTLLEVGADVKAGPAVEDGRTM